MPKNRESPGTASAEAPETSLTAATLVADDTAPVVARDHAHLDLPACLDRRRKPNTLVIEKPQRIPDPNEIPLPAAYSAARRALAEACRVDEAKAIRDQSLAMQVYAFQTKDAELGAWVTDIARRARRRIGEIMAEIRAAGQLAKGTRGQGRPKIGGLLKNPPNGDPTLESLGIDKNLAHQARRDAAVPFEVFEAEIAKDRELVTAAIKGGAKSVIKQARTKMNREKRERRDERERELAARILALPDAKYGVIVEDFEWDFEVRSRATGMDRHAANHYPVAEDAHTAEELHERTKARFECAAPDCVLFMWTTVPHLAIAIDLMRPRGFRYVSNYVWGKSQDQPGAGFWSRNKHEHLLIGVKGSIPCPTPGTQLDSLIMAPRGGHSEKPERFLEMIEQYFPNIPKIELNRRGPARPGWDAWGNETAAGGSI